MTDIYILSTNGKILKHYVTPRKGISTNSEDVELFNSNYSLKILDNESENNSSTSTIIEVQKPTLVLAHNKTLAGQLYSEFKEFLPKNRVEYFVS